MLKVNFSEKRLGLVSATHYVYDFLIKFSTPTPVWIFSGIDQVGEFRPKTYPKAA